MSNLKINPITQRECPGCKKWFSKENIAKHRRRCKECAALPQQLTAGDLKRLFDEEVLKNHHLERRLAISQQQVQIQRETIVLKEQENARLLTLVTTQSTTNNNTTNNNDHSNNITVNVNNYYVMDQDGLRDGLDMSKLRTLGTENVGYIDKTKPLPTILKDIYCNSEHPENRVISHQFLNLQWILFRYKDHILSLNLEHDRDKMHVMLKMVCDNVEQLLDTTFENGDERILATRELLREMDNEVRQLENHVGIQKAKAMIPIWNKGQVSGVEDRIWGQYMEETTYSQNKPIP